LFIDVGEAFHINDKGTMMISKLDVRRS